MCLKQIVVAIRGALLHGMDDVLLRKDRALSIAAGTWSKAVAHIADVDQAALEEVVRDDEIPGGADG